MKAQRQARIPLIQAIEQARNSRVLSVILGDRQGMETRIAPDLVPLVSRHLRLMGHQERIDLFLYTTGGDIMSAFRVAGLVREYSKFFSVLVPFRCQSAGTLIALGADQIVMLPESQLSPVDPSINGPYNPMLQGVPALPGQIQALPVSVEEVVGYLQLARETAEIKSEAGMVAVFEQLTRDVRPMALGQVYRSRTLIRMLSRKLLQLHMKGDAAEGAIDSIVSALTEKLYSHDYIITRREAKEMQLKVEQPDAGVEKGMVELAEAYDTGLKLREPFNPLSVIGATAQGQQARVKLERAFIESTARADAFTSETAYTGTPQGLAMQPIREGWVEL